MGTWNLRDLARCVSGGGLACYEANPLAGLMILASAFQAEKCFESRFEQRRLRSEFGIGREERGDPASSLIAGAGGSKLKLRDKK